MIPFLLYLCDIQAADLQAAMLQHIILNLLIGSFFLYISQIQLVQIQLHLDMLLGIEFGQKYNRLYIGSRAKGAETERRQVSKKATRDALTPTILRVAPQRGTGSPLRLSIHIFAVNFSHRGF